MSSQADLQTHTQLANTHKLKLEVSNHELCYFLLAVQCVNKCRPPSCNPDFFFRLIPKSLVTPTPRLASPRSMPSTSTSLTTECQDNVSHVTTQHVHTHRARRGVNMHRPVAAHAYHICCQDTIRPQQQCACFCKERALDTETTTASNQDNESSTSKQR